MKKHHSRNPLIATVLLGALLIAYAARASFLGIPDGDSASLIQLLVTSMRQLNTLNDQLGTIRQTYAETKKLAGYTEDAVAAFQGLARADFSDGVQLLEDAIPNLRYFDREAHHLNSWTQGQGELIALARSCVRAVQRNSARETQILRGEVRQLKDIEAYRLLGENADRKQQIDDRAREQQQILDGATHMTAPEIRMTAPGFDLRGDR